MEKEAMALKGPVLKVDGQLLLLVPLDSGGAEMVECSPGISAVAGNFLKIVIPEWLAGVLRIEEGDMVCVGYGEDEFHVQASQARPVH